MKDQKSDNKLLNLLLLKKGIANGNVTSDTIDKLLKSFQKAVVDVEPRAEGTMFGYSSTINIGEEAKTLHARTMILTDNYSTRKSNVVENNKLSKNTAIIKIKDQNGIKRNKHPGVGPNKNDFELVSKFATSIELENMIGALLKSGVIRIWDNKPNVMYIAPLKISETLSSKDIASLDQIKVTMPKTFIVKVESLLTENAIDKLKVLEHEGSTITNRIASLEAPNNLLKAVAPKVEDDYLIPTFKIA